MTDSAGDPDRVQGGFEAAFPWLTPAAFVVGVIGIIGVTALIVLIPEPGPKQWIIFRIDIALAAAGFATALTGALTVRLAIGPRVTVNATGALGVFLLVFHYDPASVAVAPPQPPEETGAHSVAQRALLACAIADASLASAGPGQWIDLIAAANLTNSNCIKSGRWSLQDNVLSVKSNGLLVLPVKPGGPYELEVHFRRLEGDHDIVVFLPMGNRHTTIQLGYDGRFDMVGDQSRFPTIVENRKLYALKATVTWSSSIANVVVDLNEADGYLTLRKPIDDIKVFSANWETGVPGAFALGADAKIEFTTVRARMLSEGDFAPLVR